MKKRKILVWYGVALLTVMALVGLMALFFLVLPAAQFRKFLREHEPAVRRAVDSMRPALRWNEGAGKSPLKNAGSPQGPNGGLDVAREFRSIWERDPQVVRFVYRLGSQPFQTSGLSLILPATSYVEKPGPPLRYGEPLRRHVIDEMAVSLSARRLIDLDYPQGKEFDVPTTASVRLAPLLDQAGVALARDEWKWPDLAAGELADALPCDFLPPAAVLRAQLLGQGERAGHIMENTLRLHLLRQLQTYFSLNPMYSGGHVFDQTLNGLLLALGEVDGLTTHGLAESEAMLRGARIDEPRMRELRAAQAMAINGYFREMAMPDLHERIWETKLGAKALRGLVRIGRAGTAALIKPAARAWAEGNEKDYCDAIRRLQVLNMLHPQENLDWEVVRLYPIEQAESIQRNPINERIDWLRFLIAAARFHKAEGRAPNGIDELAPRYLDRAFLESPDDFWGVATLPAATYPGPLYSNRTKPEEKRFAAALARFRKEHGRLPRNTEELCAMAGGGTAVVDYFRKHFAELKPRTIYFHAHRFNFSRSYLTMVDQAHPDEKKKEWLRNFPEGADRLEMLSVEAICWMPEAFRPERMKVLSGVH